MYGLINESIRGLVTEQAGDAAWERIVDRSAVGYGSFAAMSYYPDEVTYELVDAASIELDVPAHELLRRFGHYWSTRIAVENYAEYLADRDLETVLAGLDAMHARLQALFPKLRPPSILVGPPDGDVLTVHYRSEREGLAPFVLGLLEGLGDVCEEPAAVSMIEPREPGVDHDIFRVERG